MKRFDILKLIEQRLHERRQELLRSVDSVRRELRNESFDQSWEDGEEEVDSLGDDIASLLVEHACDELDQIDRALSRFDEGTFGDCERCGRKIAAQRLEALPFVTTCIRCQEQIEEFGGVIVRGDDREWPSDDWWEGGSAGRQWTALQATF
jgi:RNA polymerase-binding transcription factor DksA